MESNTKKIKIYIIPGFIYFFILSLIISCSNTSGSKTEKNVSVDSIIPETLFGATVQWNTMADKIGEGGDLIRDRSFRTMDPASPSFHPGGFHFINSKLEVWNKWPVSTTGVEFADTIISDTADNYPGGKSYPGYLRIKREPAAGYNYTGIFQTMFVNQPVNFFLKNDTSYTLYFSSYGVNLDDDPTIEVYITNGDHFPKAASSVNITSLSGEWKHHEITLTTDSSGSTSNIIEIYLVSGNNNNEVLIDEVRLFETIKEPGINDLVKTGITDLGIRSLRYPGGTLTDFFFWKDSVGSIIKRGEMMTYNTLETPVIGLHEFLNFCEMNSIVPLIQVNVLDTTDNAADLVEYILGSSATTQGAVRAANGRTDPWDATLFEIGNEPVSFYKGSGTLEETGKNYAQTASAVIAKMKAKSAEIGIPINVGGVSEASYQLPDWMTPGLNTTVDMLYYWNSYVFADGGFSAKIDFVPGHFYASRYLHNDTETDYRYILSGGEVLRKTLEDKVKPYTGDLPLWITEYHVTVEDDVSKVIQTSYSNDYQSGLAIADMLLMMMTDGVGGAYVHNLAQENCWGLINYNKNWALRPAGIVFKMLSAAAGEKLLNVSVDNKDLYTISTGAGNVPSGLQYPLVTVVATLNITSGKPRVFLLNRDYSADKTVVVTLQDFVPGNAVQYLYTDLSVTANNEIDPNEVSAASSSVSFPDSFTLTIPAHSLIRIDFQ